MTTAQVLELMHSAPNRFKRLHGKAHVLSRRYGSKRPAQETDSYEFWLDGPDRIRVEPSEGMDEGTVLVIDGYSWWQLVGGVGVISGTDGQCSPYFGSPLAGFLEVATRMGVYNYQLLGEGLHAGRAVWLLESDNDEATREILVDQERGAVMKMTMMIDGVLAYSGQLSEVEFDPEVGEEIFNSGPPPGEPLLSYAEFEAYVRPTVAEAAERASFPLLVPSHIHGPLEPQTAYRPAGPNREELVTLHYGVAGGVLSLFESAAVDDSPSGGDWERLDHHGQVVHVKEPDGEEWRRVVVQSHGTRVHIAGQLGRQEMLDVVSSLKPAGPAPDEA